MLARILNANTWKDKPHYFSKPENLNRKWQGVENETHLILHLSTKAGEFNYNCTLTWEFVSILSTAPSSTNLKVPSCG